MTHLPPITQADTAILRRYRVRIREVCRMPEHTADRAAAHCGLLATIVAECGLDPDIARNVLDRLVVAEQAEMFPAMDEDDGEEWGVAA